jgi:hypothetical protein
MRRVDTVSSSHLTQLIVQLFPMQAVLCELRNWDWMSLTSALHGKSLLVSKLTNYSHDQENQWESHASPALPFFICYHDVIDVITPHFFSYRDYSQTKQHIR